MKLLIADDERELTEVLVVLLKQNNYEVDAVFEGKSALEYSLLKRYDGIILDVMMPQKSGFEALAEMRARGVDTPVLMLTAKADVSDRVKGLDLGANDYLLKPFSTSELLARIRAMTRDQTTSKPVSVKVGNVMLNYATFEISGTSSSVLLGANEFKLMEFLLTNEGKSISAEPLIKHIWENDASAETALPIYCSYLQRKLLAIGGDITIQTSDGAVTLKAI
jgi:DNA-binding response OmpR family regulator